MHKDGGGRKTDSEYDALYPDLIAEGTMSTKYEGEGTWNRFFFPSSMTVGPLECGLIDNGHKNLDLDREYRQDEGNGGHGRQFKESQQTRPDDS